MLSDMSSKIVKAVDDVGEQLVSDWKQIYLDAINLLHKRASDGDGKLEDDREEWQDIQKMLSMASEALPIQELFDMQSGVGRKLASAKADLLTNLCSLEANCRHVLGYSIAILQMEDNHHKSISNIIHQQMKLPTYA